MNKLRFFLLIALPIGNSACSPTAQLTNVDKYVIEACGIVRNESGDNKGAWVAPAMENTETPWNAYTEQVSRLEGFRNFWQGKIVSATAAAQLNEAFRPLANAIKSMLDTMTFLVELRISYSSLSPAYERLNEYNSHLATWRTECNATSARLPG